jgi:hypothetical protein
MQQVQNDEDDDNNEQGMDPISRARYARADVPAKSADQPQDDQNDDDGPQHMNSPFE